MVYFDLFCVPILSCLGLLASLSCLFRCFPICVTVCFRCLRLPIFLCSSFFFSSSSSSASASFSSSSSSSSSSLFLLCAAGGPFIIVFLSFGLSVCVFISRAFIRHGYYALTEKTLQVFSCLNPKRSQDTPQDSIEHGYSKAKSVFDDNPMGAWILYTIVAKQKQTSALRPLARNPHNPPNNMFMLCCKGRILPPKHGTPPWNMRNTAMIKSFQTPTGS